MGTADITEQRARALVAKLSLPHMGFILGRPRLSGLLEPVKGGGLVYLVAGPGYGKTAFIVDRLSSAFGQTVYFSVDEADSDPVRFVTYLMAGLGMQPPEGPGTQPLDWSPSGGLDATVLDLAAQVVEFASHQAGHPTLIAIDDFHLADSSSQVVNALRLIIRGLPPGWTVIVSSRRSIPLGLDAISQGGRFVELHARELRLTPHEVASWAARSWDVELQGPEARMLWRVTEGWPAALVLLGQRLLSGRSRITRDEIVRTITRVPDLRAYLEQDILAGLSPYAARTMLTAGLLPRVMFPRDEAFFPGPPGQAEAALEDLVRRGYLVARAGRRSYTVHPLVQGFAQREAWQGAETAQVIQRTALHLERVGEHHQAVSLYLRVGRFQDAARLLRSMFVSSFTMPAGSIREEWFSLLSPDDPLDETAEAWLTVAKARILQDRTEYAEAAFHYERAARALAARDDEEGLLPVLLGSALCLFNQGLWEESLAVMKRCRTLATSPRQKVEVLVVEGGVLVSLCRWDEAVENWEKALVIAPGGEKAALSQRIYVHRARLFYSLGHYRLAMLWAEKAIDRAGGPPTYGRALALNGAAIVAGLTGDYDRAERFADECQRLARTRGYSLLEAPSLLCQARVAVGRWDYRRAVTKIGEARALAVKAGDAEEGFWAESMLGNLCRRTGNPQRALEHHQVALDIVEKNRLAAFERVEALAALGMDLVLIGMEAEARASLEETVRVSRRWGLKTALTPALFYLGWLYARAGREHEAGRSLTEAVRIAEEHGHVHFLRQEAKVAVPILALCDRFGAGSFLRDTVVPKLPDRLQTYFFELAEGKTYPTDVALGPPRRRSSAGRMVVRGTAGEAAPEVVARIETLTEREREVLKMVGLGLPNKVIGATLYISEKTVKTHTNHIFRKLGVGNRTQATLALQSYQRAKAEALKGHRGRR
ncbi:MAG: LuxR C-terminal-related transcriptional regulator [Actinomycetia bacterium]|nr:LuxR C-terminal-related transcriptional regulator [Actinomycetes bacterium]